MFASLVFALAATQPIEKYFPAPLPYPPEMKAQLEKERESRLLALTGPRILYLNFDGAHLTGGLCNNSRSNCSHILTGASYDFPAYTGSSKATIVSLVQGFYAPFNVQVVTARPNSGDYSMTMVGPGSGVLGSDSLGAAGIALLDCGDLNPDDIAFAFTDTAGQTTRSIAVTIAQESAHAFGLGHTDNPVDLMYPVLQSQAAEFVNANMLVCDYGPGWPSQCLTGSDCSGTGHQNSFQLLMQNVGASGPDVTPPSITFNTPHDGDTVGYQFHVQFDVNDDREVSAVELFVDGAGQPIGNIGQAPWAFDLPGGSLPPGQHQLKGIATDMAGNRADSTEITVTVQPPGSNPGELGSACTVQADCPGGLCAFDTGANRHFCTRTCDMMANPCPQGFECVNGGGPMVCAPSTGMAGGGSGGGCNMTYAARQGSSLAGLLLLGLGTFALVFARARRK